MANLPDDPQPTAGLFSIPSHITPEHYPLFFWVVEQSPISVIITDAQTNIVYVNSRFSQLTGYSPAEVLGKNPKFMQSGDTPGHVYLQLWETLALGKEWRGEFLNKKRSGEVFWEDARIMPIKNTLGSIAYYIGLLEDLSERKQTQKRFEHLSFHDPLTDLPNHLMFEERLKHALQHARQTSTSLAVILLDLDRFKVINETLGPVMGDQIIQLAGRRLTACVGEYGMVARRGGDEFLLLLTRIGLFREVAHFAQTLLDVFKQPFAWADQEIHVAASLGISLFPDDGQEAGTLMQHADNALFDAKDSGRNTFKFYKIRSTPMVAQRLALETDFRHALERNEFRVFYQPQIDLTTGKMAGMEALVRWQHPQHGLLAPGHFIPLAEETGLIVPLGKWILATACAQNRAWQEDGFPPLRLSVNLSGRQFMEPELVETILRIVETSGLHPQWLELEITESVMMKDVAITSMILRWLNKKGIRIAIDDFGTGYSAMQYLKQFPIDTLKIDYSFIKDIETHPDSAAVVKAMVLMAKSLGLTVIAEGVETEGQLRFLTQLSCDQMQGFLFSPPVSSERFTELLQSGRSLPMPT